MDFVNIIFVFIRMTKNIGFIFKMVDGNNILVNSIINFWNFIFGWFIGNFYTFEILNCIVSNVAKKSLSDELEVIFICLELFWKLFNFIGNAYRFINWNNFRITIGKLCFDFLIFDFYRSYWIETYIRKTIVVTMIVATF